MIWLFAMLAVLALAVAMLILGLRGRIIDDHAHCRRCGFDLVGLALTPSAEGAEPVCPECGRRVGTPGAIRIGTRVRKRGLILSGTAILLLVVILAGSAAWFAVKGSSFYAKLPTSVLRWLIPHDSLCDLDAIGTELANRIAAGKEDSKEVSRILDAALVRQADWSRKWPAPLGEAIEAAVTDGLISDEQFDRYCASAVHLHDKVRENITTGGEVPIKVGFDDHTGRTGVVKFQAHLLDILLDDSRIDGERCSYGGPVGYPGYAGVRFGSVATEYVLLEMDRQPSEQTPGFDAPRADTLPGQHKITTVWAVTTGPAPPASGRGGGGAGWSRSHTPAPHGTPPTRTLENIRARALECFASKDGFPGWSSYFPGEHPSDALARHTHVALVRFEHAVTILPADPEPVALITDAAVTAGAAGAVRATTWVQPTAPPWRKNPCLSMNLSSSASVAIAGNVYWKSSGAKKFLASIVLPGASSGSSTSTYLVLPDTAEIGETIELVIEPDPVAAHRTIDCYKIVGTDIPVSVKVDEQTRARLRGESK